MPTPLAVFAVVFVAFAAAMLLMAVGVLARRPCLKGSCGGLSHGVGPGCAGCPNRRHSNRAT